ncbi:hypothetical protein G7046_g5102 [Stylonectria norvegica]|nr:hypothetical protein G7046_g5102 [Stylonectria norvegica]
MARLCGDAFIGLADLVRLLKLRVDFILRPLLIFGEAETNVADIQGVCRDQGGMGASVLESEMKLDEEADNQASRVRSRVAGVQAALQWIRGRVAMNGQIVYQRLKDDSHSGTDRRTLRTVPNMPAGSKAPPGPKLPTSGRRPGTAIAVVSGIRSRHTWLPTLAGDEALGLGSAAATPVAIELELLDTPIPREREQQPTLYRLDASSNNLGTFTPFAASLTPLHWVVWKYIQATKSRGTEAMRMALCAASTKVYHGSQKSRRDSPFAFANGMVPLRNVPETLRLLMLFALITIVNIIVRLHHLKGVVLPQSAGGMGWQAPKSYQSPCEVVATIGWRTRWSGPGAKGKATSPWLGRLFADPLPVLT